MHFEYVPDALVGALEGAETYADAQQSLAAPVVARCKGQFADRLRLAGVHGEPHGLVNVLAEQLFQHIIVLIEACAGYCDDEVEEGLQSGLLARRVVLYLEYVVACGIWIVNFVGILLYISISN